MPLVGVIDAQSPAARGGLRTGDLLISVDTAPIHLAGALGIPGWLLLPEKADWRWMRAGSSWRCEIFSTSAW